jgi:hypothetical protein
MSGLATAAAVLSLVIHLPAQPGSVTPHVDPQLFAWLRAQSGRMASLFGADRRMYVYDAAPPPARRPLAGVGDRVVAHRRPVQGRSGTLVAVLDELHAAPSGIPARMGIVRFEDGRLAPVPLANLEAVEESN